MKAVLTKATIEMTENNSGAEPTCRLLSDAEAGLTEWRENATIDDVPVSVYYMTDADDTASADANYGDLGLVDWENCVDRIEIDICECDRQDISDEAIAALAKKLN